MSVMYTTALFEKLSERETKLLCLLACGYNDKEIAHQLFISRRRVGEIISNLKQKLDVSTRVGLGIIAYHLHLIELQDMKRKSQMASENES
ncbi:LuxR C-terminal-related transcriptional regulator [Paenibacillus larvae]|jgi:DNA-binding NarL/FixJ family response regulator|nr:LuxR C-terminal-related transcriptional regulator [Paenibacillus larvae]AVF20581.1 transcriptional regulator, LuxR family [Paenibacillus larvae subsp. larvae]AVF28161.1 transcriptional regulator, LuxR family [Paenibacillus larvae subsp. larvae]AVF32664.1 transcriptional regulator, LuxR family [Paenibacillus larvae subsp. larvae]AVG11278.1 transcriptional regulator, LuxR family [Paenibacillus larvae subsp. larvae DSM 25430]ETK28459.1 transcriptional regulator, LuxR family [Paenibacillus larv